MSNVRFNSRMALCLAALCLGLATIGCGGSGEPKVELLTVSGKVTFSGAPVTEGDVNFDDSATGHAASAALGADGSYSTPLPAGNYAVTVTPPLVTVDAGPDSPSSQEYKQVENIPAKFHSADSSGLTATVANGQTEHNFDLK